MEPKDNGPSDGLHRPGSSRAPDEAVHELHARLIAGDLDFLELIASRLLRPLQRALRRSFPRATDDLITDAVEDAILEYGGNPSRFDRSRGIPLDRFLQHAAKRNLINLLQIEARRYAREARYAEHATQASSQTRFAPPEIGENSEFHQQLLAIASDAAERAAVHAWLTGGGSVIALAAALSLLHLPPVEQRKEIKRFKDRITRRIVRRFGAPQSSPTLARSQKRLRSK